jgi:hypothetical protein
MIRIWRSLNSVSIFALLAAGLMGCGSADSKISHAKDNGKETAGQVKVSAGEHGGWWCDEHGVPEAECSVCDAKVAAEFKKKGDWCEKHDRALSQCFICTPKAKDRYAAIYRAKEGKEPPPIQDDEKK